MQRIFLIVFILAVAGAAGAQEQTAGASAPQAGAATQSSDYVHETLKKGAWETGLLAGGGDGLGKSDNTQFMYAGGRVGVVLTGEHLPGWLRGNFEWAGDVLPIFTVFPPNSAVYGGSIRPVIWQWNFTSKQKIAPYFAAVGGIIFTRQNIPPGDTSQVNFSSGASFGANVFTRPGRAVKLEMSILHISNASLGNHNPGYNGSIFFTLGYSWFHGGH
jgi:lipid A 3-O-deacylase